MKKVGIVSYGTYVPEYRLVIDGQEKSVPDFDEDAVTMAVASAKSAIDAIKLSPALIDTLLIGSESHPYAVKPSSSIVGGMLGIGNNYLAADLEFACKAATTGAQLTSGLIKSGDINYGLVVGSDTAQSAPGDALEKTSAAASASLLLGSKNIAATLLSSVSFTSDTPDFWRRDGVSFPSHSGRFTGEPSYFRHVEGAARKLIEKEKINPKEITWCVFHMPNQKFPRQVSKRLGFCEHQIKQSLVVDSIGNPYSASCLLGLSATLDIAKPGDSIFMVSYGSGAGSDAFLWKVNKEIEQIQKYRKRNKIFVRNQIMNKKYIDYSTYLKLTHKI